MNQSEFYTQWLAALRGGNYEQGGGALRVDNKFCCLGVACDVAWMNNDWGGEWRFNEPSITNFLIDEEMAVAVLPTRLQDLLGMSSTGTFHVMDGEYWHDEESGRTYVGVQDLSALNDDGFTFDQIADLIEYFFAPKSV